MALEQEISKGIMEAMKAKDTVRLTTLRNVKKYIIEAKTASAGITELSDAEVLKIIAKLAKQGAESAAVYAQQNRPDLAAEESAQVAVLQTFLPKQMTGEELTEAVRSIIAEVGATSSSHDAVSSGTSDIALTLEIVSASISNSAQMRLSRFLVIFFLRRKARCFRSMSVACNMKKDKGRLVA